MTYDVGIVGGGLAGLSLAIQIAKGGNSVALFEKSQFPFHKLCGEYLSKESLPFLEYLGFDAKLLQPANIERLRITNSSGKDLLVNLPLGGIGISRYRMDEKLAEIAKTNGAKIFENTLVQSVNYIDNKHLIKTKNGTFQSKILISAYGKKSNLIKRNSQDKVNSNDYLGIKYHARLSDYPEDLISMHNFKDGYCGVCRLEEEWVSICYLSHTDNLKAAGNSISKMQDEILFKNQEIRDLFEKAEFLYEKPLAVSNISFKKKDLFRENVFYVGDAAGLITPLCGNGMSMSLHASAILGPLLLKFLNNEVSYQELVANYIRQWKKQFKTRMAVGRTIQKIFRKERSADIGLSLLNAFPFFNRKIISLTHGQVFNI